MNIFYPEEHQPSGTVNWSRIDRCNISIWYKNCRLCEDHEKLNMKCLTKYLIYDLSDIVRSYLICESCQKKERYYDFVNDVVNKYLIPDLSNIVMNYFISDNKNSINYVYLSPEERRNYASLESPNLMNQI